jgi:chromosome partitioning protein
MQTILVCNSKGGVGKSLIADELAFSFERTETPFSFYDLDSQGGTVHKTLKRPDAVVSVVDTPGALQSQLSDWMKFADLIIIPTRTTSRDIEPLQRMQQIVEANAPQTSVIYVLNGWDPRFRAARDFAEWFEDKKGSGKMAYLPQSQQYVQASAYGKSVVKYASGKSPALAMKELVNMARATLGLPTE